MPCAACRTSHLGYITSESQIPAAVLALALRPETKLASWLDGSPLRWCSACGRIFELWFDPRDQYYELTELPGELLSLLQDSGSVEAAVALLKGERFVPAWVERWFDAGRYDLKAAVDALAHASAETNATPARIECLVRGWAAVRARVAREQRRIDLRLDAFAAAAARKDVFRQPNDAYIQKRIDELLASFRRAQPAAPPDPLDILAGLRERPGDERSVEVQRALLDLRDRLPLPEQAMPEERAAKLLTAFNAASSWPAPAPGSFAAMVRRDVRELLDTLYRAQRLPPRFQPEVSALLDSGAMARFAPSALCREQNRAAPASACPRCAAVCDGDTDVPPDLARVRRSGWTDANPAFVGGDWVVVLRQDWLAVCPDCDAYFWLRGTVTRPAPHVTRFSSALRILLASPCNIDAVVALLSGPAYHADRLRGLRDLAWRLVEGGYGYYAPQAFLNALIELVARPGLCADVVQDVVELIARLLAEATRRIDDWNWSRDGAVAIEVAGPLLELLRGAALAHVPAETQRGARERIRSTLARAVLTSSGDVVSGLRYVAPALLDLLESRGESASA